MIKPWSGDVVAVKEIIGKAVEIVTNGHTDLVRTCVYVCVFVCVLYLCQQQHTVIIGDRKEPLWLGSI